MQFSCMPRRKRKEFWEPHSLVSATMGTILVVLWTVRNSASMSSQELGITLLPALHNMAQGTLCSCLRLSAQSPDTQVFCSCTDLGLGNWDPATLLPLYLLLKPGRNDPSTWKSPKLSKASVAIPHLHPIQQGITRTYTQLPEWEEATVKKERKGGGERLKLQKYYLATIVSFLMWNWS